MLFGFVTSTESGGGDFIPLYGEDMENIQERLEYLRGELRAERISYGELAELQSLVPYIEAGDVELLKAAGVPESPEE
jgi:hypothetical protein